MLMLSLFLFLFGREWDVTVKVSVRTRFSTRKPILPANLESGTPQAPAAYPLRNSASHLIIIVGYCIIMKIYFYFHIHS